MKTINLYAAVVCDLFLILALISLCKSITFDKKIHKPVQEECIINQEHFFNKSPELGLLEALSFYNVRNPKVVYAQAILETGYFKSKVCNVNNNLFGLYDSNKKDYFKFNHWSESILFYKKCFQNDESEHLSDEAYLDYLLEVRHYIGKNASHFEKTNYKNKVRSIMKNNPIYD